MAAGSFAVKLIVQLSPTVTQGRAVLGWRETTINNLSGKQNQADYPGYYYQEKYSSHAQSPLQSPVMSSQGQKDQNQSEDIAVHSVGKLRLRNPLQSNAVRALQFFIIFVCDGGLVGWWTGGLVGWWAG